MSEVKRSTTKTSSAGKARSVSEVTLRTSDESLWCDSNLSGVSSADYRRPLNAAKLCLTEGPLPEDRR